MTDPERWLQAKDAPTGMSEMLAAAQKASPTVVQKAALAAKLGVASSGVWLMPFWKSLAVGGSVLGVVWAVSTTERGESTDSVQTSPSLAMESPSAMESRSVPAAPLDPGVAKPIESEQTAGDRARDSTVYDTTQVTRDSSPLRQRDVPTEAALIKDARSALDAFPKQALALLAQHAALYPKGVLSEEREVLRIRALKNIGRVGDAEAEEQKFRKAHPGSVHHLP